MARKHLPGDLRASHLLQKIRSFWDRLALSFPPEQREAGKLTRSLEVDRRLLGRLLLQHGHEVIKVNQRDGDKIQEAGADIESLKKTVMGLND